MFKFIKNKFMFIIAISILTLVLLIIGAITLYKDESESFNNEGYIISTTTKKNAKYYFSANTKYKDNADNKVAFKDNKSKKVSVDPASFVHYNNGSIAFLQKGALVNLNEINSPIISYYNVTRSNLIKKDNNNYSITSNGEDINLNSFIGRISDKKYIIAGNNLTLEIPTKNDKISGEYFEITYIKDGIVKIDNKDISYQVTAQNSFVNVGNNIRINLGNEKIYYDGSAKMLLSQITINGDENINLDVNKKDSAGSSGDGNGENGETNSTTSESGNGSGNSGGSGSEEGDTTDSTSQNTTTTSTTTDTANSKNANQTGDNTGTGNGGNKGTSVGADNNVKIELISADITSTSINALFQLNNASLIKGKLIATLTNVQTNEKEEPINIPANNGSFNVNKKALLPNTEYNLTITDSGDDNTKQFFQKTFKTKDLGITLEKQFSTDSSLSYNVIFDNNSEVSKAKIVIYDNSGLNESISPNEFTVSKADSSSLIEFTNLISNSSYSVSVDTVWIDNIAYKDLYTINRIDTTLKKAPIISDIQIKANTEEVKFNIKANNIQDPDNGIVSYTYKVYKSDSINIDGTDPELVYTVTKNDSDPIDLDLTKIDTMKTGVNYRCKVFAQYNDNEMIREAESDYSGNFLIKSKPNISWESTNITADEIKGKLSLIDASCSIPIRGRSCLSQSNNFILRYYKISEGEANSKEISIDFNYKDLIADIDIKEGLSSSTAYAFKLYANYYDDNNNLHQNIQIGDPFYVTTDESTKVKFKVKKDNESGRDHNGAEIVTFDASLVKPNDSNADEDTASITLKLYSGSYNTEEKLIGTYTINERNLIDDFYNNFTITNILFENETLGKLDSLQKMIKATNNGSLNGRLNRTYTVEIAEIVSQNGSTDSIEVEDKVYTFKLTPKYYLDSMIASRPTNKFVDVTLIAKKDLTEEEYNELSRSISNLDELGDDTIVGVTIDNSLSDDDVDLAFTYQKVTVDYVVYNTVTDKEAKRISINMDNKYQPKSQTIYLSETELDDGEEFTRGYNYKIGYEIKFSTEDGSNPIYTNERLYAKKDIPHEEPTVKQYISTSSSNDITYRYSIKDIDFALKDKKLYYKIGDSNTYQKVNNDLVDDGDYHNITIPISERKKYSVYLNTKGTDGKSNYLAFSNYRFESEYNYDDTNLYTLANDNDNTLKIKFLNNDITNRAAAYKVNIKATDDSNIEEFNRYFIASQLYKETIENNDEQNSTSTIKYIAIDYAYISRFLKHDLKVSVTAYYDSGLIGFNQNTNNGFILENINAKENEQYLNIYQGYTRSSHATQDLIPPTVKKENIVYGIYKMAEEYQNEASKINMYNHLSIIMRAKDNPPKIEYIPQNGVTEVNNVQRGEYLKSFDIDYGKKGLIFDETYEGYNVKVLKTANLKTENNNYRFNDIIPKVSLKTSTATINSLKINVTTSGVYGQFIKDNNVHNKFYIDIYSDAELNNKLTTVTSNVTINDNSITAETVEYKNLKPNTKYYATVSAYIDNRLTKLYDIDSTTSYVTKVYELKTLDDKGILDKIYFHVNPTDYSGETSTKELAWNLSLKNKENYKIRFELFDKEGNQVNFNGTTATNCHINDFGSSENGYINGCYIQISKDEVENLSGTYKYTFSGNDFLFGAGYYKLLVYAIPYTNNQYVEDDKLIIYQNDGLKTENKVFSSGISYDIEIPVLEKPTFTFNTLVSGARCITEKDSDGNVVMNNNSPVCQNTDEDEYYIDFSLTAIDKHYVVKYGKYNINLKDINDNIIATKYDVPINQINKTYTFANLTKDTTYNIEIVYQLYLNNYDTTEKEKSEITNNYISTPIDKGVTPGNITAKQEGDNKIILSFDKYNMIEKIKKVNYNIKLNSSTQQTFGEINIGTSAETSLEVTGPNSKPKLTIDFSEDENFTLKKGNSYLIITEYYYEIDDQNGQWIVDGNSMKRKQFTTTLNL